MILKQHAFSALRRLVDVLGLTLLRRRGYATLCERLDVAERIARSLIIARRQRRFDSSVPECIVFSKDRPLQLHGLLTSLRNCVNPVPFVRVLYKATIEPYQCAYRELSTEFAGEQISLMEQDRFVSFKDQVVGLIRSSSSERLFFLVDDDLFTEKVDLRLLSSFDTRYVIPSLRLGENLSYCYVQQKNQSLPPFLEREDILELNLPEDVTSHPSFPDLLFWKWGSGQLDWGRPLSLDGNIFSTEEMLILSERMQFGTPNTLESSMQKHRALYRERVGVCFRKSLLLGVPWNKVQVDNLNISGTIHQDALLAQWQAGYRLRVANYLGYRNRSAHEELELWLSQRS
jgi:hypothetical protein